MGSIPHIQQELLPDALMAWSAQFRKELDSLITKSVAKRRVNKEEEEEVNNRSNGRFRNIAVL